MSGVSIPALVVVGLIGLIGFAVSGLMVARSQAEAQRLASRIQDALRPHARSHRVWMSALVRAKSGPQRSLRERVSGWFGFDPARPEQCPVPWWVVLAVALVSAKAGQSAAAMLFGNWSWLALPALWIVSSRLIFNWFANRRRDKLLTQFPDALTMIVRSVRVGVPVGEAIRAVARETPLPTGPEFAQVTHRLAVGGQLDEAVRELAARTKLSEYRFFAMTLSLQAQTGGGLSETLEGLADMIRRRLAVRERGKALASEAKMSIYVLSVLPPLCGGALALLNPQYFGVLLHDPTGRKLLGGAIGSLTAGWMVMRTMMKKSLS